MEIPDMKYTMQLEIDEEVKKQVSDYKQGSLLLTSLLLISAIVLGFILGLLAW